MRYPSLLIVFLWLQIPCISHADNSATIDSLVKALKGSMHDTIRVESLLKLGEQVYLVDPEKALEYWESALELSEEVGFTGGISTSMNNIGFIYQQQSRHQEALKIYRRCLELKKEHNDTEGIAYSNNNIGMVHHNLGQSDRALEVNRSTRRILGA